MLRFTLTIRMKILCLFLFIAVSGNSFGQLISGALLDEGRKLTSTTAYVLEGTIDGWAKYELSVDRLGNVTATKLIDTDIKRTSAKIQLHNHAKTLKFQAGTYYPEFHHVIVKFTLVKPVE